MVHYTLNVKATDAEGHNVTLGPKTITVDNANAVKPFGAIDTPAQGGSASGASFFNWGWVLTPQPNSIPTDGSTINVWVDSVNLGHPTYNIYRADIAGLFPGCANSNGAAGYFYLDTTAYENGVHTIQWTASDSGGNSDGIGSRYFTIQNIGSSSSLSGIECSKIHGVSNRIENIRDIPVIYDEPVRIRKGYRSDIEYKKIYPDENGVVYIIMEELERIVLNVSEPGTEISGYLEVGNFLL